MSITIKYGHRAEYEPVRWETRYINRTLGNPSGAYAGGVRITCRNKKDSRTKRERAVSTVSWTETAYIGQEKGKEAVLGKRVSRV